MRSCTVALVALACGCADSPGSGDGDAGAEQRADASAGEPDAGEPSGPGQAPIRAPIAAELALEVQEPTGAGQPNRVHELASVEVVTGGPERRAVSLRMPVRYIDAGTPSPADRLYHQAIVACTGDGGPFTAHDPVDGTTSASFSQVQNLLAGASHTLAPRVIVDFPEGGAYTCRARYVLRTSRDFTGGEDGVVTGEGGYLEVSAPLSPWVERCYWPTAMDEPPAGCEDVGASPEALIPFGASLERTAVEVVVPHGATAVVRADASLSTCAGTGGASAELCPDDVTSELSKVRSRIVVVPRTDAPACQPVLEGQDAAWTTITGRVHHAASYNQVSFVAAQDPACDGRYRIFQELTVTSGAASLVHGNGTTLLVTDR